MLPVVAVAQDDRGDGFVGVRRPGLRPLELARLARPVMVFAPQDGGDGIDAFEGVREGGGVSIAGAGR